MNVKRLQIILWIVFLTYYSYLKYFAALDTWDTEYFIQVAILVILTAVAPFYLAQWLSKQFEGSTQIAVTVISPLILCAIGYASFYYTRVKPSFPDVTLTEVLPRSFLPGIAIAILLMIPVLVKLNSGEKELKPEDD